MSMKSICSSTQDFDVFVTKSFAEITGDERLIKTPDQSIQVYNQCFDVLAPDG